MDTDLRSALEANINAGAANDGPGNEPPAVGVSDTAPNPDAAAATASPGDTDGTAGDSGAGQTSAAQGRARDAAGKFAKGAEAKTAAPKQGAVTETKAAAAAAPSSTGTQPPVAGGDSSQTPAPATTFKPPTSWTPAAREALAKADPAIQKEVQKWDFDIQRTMREAAPAKKFAQDVHQAIGHIAQASGMPVEQLVRNYAAAEAALGHPSQQVKAQAFAQLFKSYGLTDMDALISALNSPHQSQTPPPQQQHIDPKAIAAQVRQEVERGFVQTQATRELEKFISSDDAEFLRGEHGNDVLADMHGRIQAAETLGREISLKEAYERAVWGIPELRAILQQREQAKLASTAQAATTRASAAASSIRNQPATATGNQGDGGVRDSILAAISSRSGR